MELARIALGLATPAAKLVATARKLRPDSVAARRAVDAEDEGTCASISRMPWWLLRQRLVDVCDVRSTPGVAFCDNAEALTSITLPSLSPLSQHECTAVLFVGIFIHPSDALSSTVDSFCLTFIPYSVTFRALSLPPSLTFAHAISVSRTLFSLSWFPPFPLL